MKNELTIITRFLGPDLLTYDPYDLWKTKLGLRLKKHYYEKGKVTIPIIAPFYLLDTYAPRLVRLFIKPQEFPIVRAFAAMSALNLYSITSEQKYIDLAAVSTKWLIENRLENFHGACWGLGMPWMTKTGYSATTTPFISVVPYCVEALLKYSDQTGDKRSKEVALTSLDYLEKDLQRLLETPNNLALSYGPSKERRIVINGNAYAMMLYALLSVRIPTMKSLLLERASHICNFIKSQQLPDGSWLYYADREPGNFIDCFHSCFVLKNLIKYSVISGEDVSAIVDKGVGYVLNHFIDKSYGLARKFSVSAHPSMVKFDLYDQAELLNLLLVTNNNKQAESLHNQIFKYFYINSKGTFGYQIDFFGRLNKMLYLRWAVMPMVYVLSKYYKKMKTGEIETI